jgi:thioesterase domain-containing protein
LRALLPEYMIPSTFDALAALPMTPNAKLDRAALPRPGIPVSLGDRLPPKGAAEQRLAAIWREVLEVEAVGGHDSFFELGGHSLLVARLLHRVRRDYGFTLSMPAFFRAHRLDDMARALATPGSTALTGFVPIQPAGTRPPLLWLDAGADFLALSASLGPDQPFLGIPILSMFQDDPRQLTSFTAAAGRVADEIRKINPDGPYHLGGFCTFGILAYEVARQLRASGAEIPLLVLVHAINPDWYLGIGRLRLLGSKVAFSTRNLVTARDRKQGALAGTLRRGLGFAFSAKSRMAPVNTLPAAAALERAAYGYLPGPYDGDAISLQPMQRVGVLDTSASWLGLVRGRFTAQSVAGSHLTMLKQPHVETAGRLLRRELERCLATIRPRAVRPERQASGTGP